MGGIDPKTFEIEFIERTQIILRKYRGDYDFTLLTNCLYSLIILTCERIKYKTPRAFQTLIDDVDELKPIIAKKGYFQFRPVNSKGRDQPRTLAAFLKRMRNSLAHAMVEPLSEPEGGGLESEWIELYFLAANKYAPHHPIELDVIFTYDELKAFALFISTLYQKEFLGLEE